MQEVSATCQGLRPRGTAEALAIAHPTVLPSATQKASASRTCFVTWLNTWPIASPVNASPQTSRSDAHDSGPMRFALPSSSGTRTLSFLPVSRRTCVKTRQVILERGNSSIRECRTCRSQVISCGKSKLAPKSRAAVETDSPHPLQEGVFTQPRPKAAEGDRCCCCRGRPMAAI